MSFRKRAGIVSVLGIIALAVYGTARYYRHPLVVYVVEQSLIQKAPPGTDPTLIREHLRALLASIPDPDTRFARVLAISQEIEKLQALTPKELEQLLSVTARNPAPGSF